MSIHQTRRPLNTESWNLDTILGDEEARLREFPIARKKIFLAHAAVTALPRAVADSVIAYMTASCEDHQEFEGVFKVIMETRAAAARIIGAKPSEIALLGPTSLGLSLFANGLPWQNGDEILCYLDDYPANVYPWKNLERQGVRVRYLETEAPGRITPEAVESQLGAKTRFVALASCHFLGGYRIDLDAIGKMLHDRGVLFSVDGIQTIGAFETNVAHVDFLSADAHKWMLGPMAIGIVYVKEDHFDLLRPSLLGAWNVRSPGFITQTEIEFESTARRYEPGVLNAAGVYGMKAALERFLDLGIDSVSRRLLDLKKYLVARLTDAGFEILGPSDGPNASSITTFRHPEKDLARLFDDLSSRGVVSSYRHDRAGNDYIRFSPHFYNTEKEIDRVFEIIDKF